MKRWYTSKTLWVNAVAFVGTVLGITGLGTLTPDEQAQIVGGVLALANIILRFATTKGLT